jgi:hypothetical protein
VAHRGGQDAIGFAVRRADTGIDGGRLADMKMAAALVRSGGLTGRDATKSSSTITSSVRVQPFVSPTAGSLDRTQLWVLLWVLLRLMAVGGRQSARPIVIIDDTCGRVRTADTRMNGALLTETACESGGFPESAMAAIGDYADRDLQMSVSTAASDAETPGETYLASTTGDPATLYAPTPELRRAVDGGIQGCQSGVNDAAVQTLRQRRRAAQAFRRSYVASVRFDPPVS